MWSLPAMVTCGPPCTVLSILAMRRAPITTTDRPAYLLWLVAVILTAVIGFGLVVGIVSHSNVADPLGAPCVIAIALLLIGGIVRLTRSRSGERTFSVDMIEAVMAVTVVIAPFVLLWGADTFHNDESWYTVPAAIAFVGFTFGIYWVVALVVRMGPNAGPIEWCGIAFTVFGAANAGMQVAQGIADFTLPAPPLIFLQACCAGAAVLVPLNLRRKPLPGLEILPPQAQVRVGYIATLLTLAGLPVMIVVGTAADERISWAPPFTLGVAATLVLLIGLRQLAGINETRRLYTHIEHAADQRRLLLAQVMQRANEDRARVASELHQQAVAAYTSVVSLVGAYRSAGKDTTVAEAASHQVRDDLAEQVEAARHLMQAIKPLELRHERSRDLAAPIQAYMDNLYGDDPTPQLAVTCDPDLYLDWSTETIALRIIQEALRNVWEHSEAEEVSVGIGAADGVAVVRVADDGVGFDIEALVEEDAPGIAAMRVFAAAVDGSVAVTSTQGDGTVVTARLGGDATTRIAPIVQLRT
jgi:signal transduction histidine kinase